MCSLCMSTDEWNTLQYRCVRFINANRQHFTDAQLASLPWPLHPYFPSLVNYKTGEEEEEEHGSGCVLVDSDEKDPKK